MRTLLLISLFLLFSFKANAWMEQWAPALECTPANVGKLPPRSASAFIESVKGEGARALAEYSESGVLDLNGDGIDDFVFIIPWMGCGLNADGSDAYFIVSGVNGRMMNILGGYGMGLSDLVIISGKTYFRHSSFFYEFEKSQHNHWMYQMFSFDTNGVMRCANLEIGASFPAVTIFYNNPKFSQIELTDADLKKIADKTKPVVKKYISH